MESSPAITVIALCYNHARFLHECLDSIRAQTCQDFELIVTDDASRDQSPELIAAWLAANRPDARYIRHTSNAGICRTLNEALAAARGEFICMIATDDAWHPERLALHLAAMRSHGRDVAVVYSDVDQMDESGAALPEKFIEQHRPGLAPPSGDIFSVLADGNFIPAMAATIRRQAIKDVGGYDERLTYEDYDMWLRLAERYQFAYCDARVARYRIVGSSIVRTLFVQPTANHSHTLFLIRQRWLRSTKLNRDQRRRWADNAMGAAYNLYVLGDPRARAAMWQAVRYAPKPRNLALALAGSLPVPLSQMKRWLSVLGVAAK